MTTPTPALGLKLGILAGLMATTSPAEVMLRGEAQGLGVSWENMGGVAMVRDTGTPANNFHGDPNKLFTNGATNPRIVYQKDGTWQFAPHNLALRSRDLSNAAWNKEGDTITANDIAGLDGTLTADKVVTTNVAATIRANASAAVVVGQLYTFSVRVRRSNFQWFQVGVAGSTALTNKFHAWFDLVNGVVGTTGVGGTGWTFASAALTDLGASFWRIDLSGTPGDATSFPFFRSVTANAATAGLVGDTYWVDGANYNKGGPQTFIFDTAASRVVGISQEYDLSTAGWALAINAGTSVINRLLWSRDLTQTWTLTNATAAKTATGIGGFANVASTLTATAANGYCRQDTATTSVRTTSVCLKRRTGTGGVFLSHGDTTGAEVSSNGSFASDTVWTKGTGWTIAAGVASAVAASADLEETVTLTTGRFYKVVYTITAFTGGTITVKIGGNAGTARASAATFTEYIQAGASGKVTFTAASATASIDNVSVLLIDEVDVTPTATWARYSAPANQSVASPPVILRVAVSGDAVDVDAFQDETNAFLSTVIFTYAATATQDVDIVTVPIAALPYAEPLTIYIDYEVQALFASNGNPRGVYAFNDNNTLNVRTGATVGLTGNSFISSTIDGAPTVTVTISAALAAGRHQGTIRYKDGDMAGTVDGGAVVTDATTAVPATGGSNFALGGTRGNATVTICIPVPLRIRKLAIAINKAVSNADLPNWRYAA